MQRSAAAVSLSLIFAVRGGGSEGGIGGSGVVRFESYWQPAFGANRLFSPDLDKSLHGIYT